MPITDFKVVYICPDHNEKYNKRKLHMEQLLKKVGFKIIEHFKSSSEEYPLCLNKATIEILGNNLDIPLIILEDDVEFTGEIECSITDEIDAIYLGISKNGGHPTENYHYGQSIFETYNDTQVKVLNMLSAHAILYLTRRYKESIIDILQKHLQKHLVTYPQHPQMKHYLGYSKIIDKGYWYNDILFSRLQSSFLVLANKKPSFFQSNKFNLNDLESQTKFIIP